MLTVILSLSQAKCRMENADYLEYLTDSCLMDFLLDADFDCTCSPNAIVDTALAFRDFAWTGEALLIGAEEAVVRWTNLSLRPVKQGWEASELGCGF